MTAAVTLDLRVLRDAIQHEYEEVAACPTNGFHFHVGRFLAARLEYPSEEVDALPDAAVESFAGVGNPFALGPLQQVEVVVDLGSGAGFDAILAAQQVGETGRRAVGAVHRRRRDAHRLCRLLQATRDHGR